MASWKPCGDIHSGAVADRVVADRAVADLPGIEELNQIFPGAGLDWSFAVSPNSFFQAFVAWILDFESIAAAYAGGWRMHGDNRDILKIIISPPEYQNVPCVCNHLFGETNYT
jgi:hypothetical protein